MDHTSYDTRHKFNMFVSCILVIDCLDAVTFPHELLRNKILDFSQQLLDLKRFHQIIIGAG